MRKFRSLSRRAFPWMVAVTLLVSLLARPGGATFVGLNKIEEATHLSEQSIPVFQRGDIDLAPVFLDGKVVAMSRSFVGDKRISASAETNAKRKAADRSYVIHSRAQKFLGAMDAYTQNILRPRGITSIERQEQILRQQLVIEVTNIGGTYAIKIGFPAESPLEVLSTVTSADLADVRFSGAQKPEEIANQGAELAKEILIEAWRDRQPPSLLRSALSALPLLLGLIVVSLLMARLQRWRKTKTDRIQAALISQSEQGASQQIDSEKKAEAPIRTTRGSQLRNLSLRRKMSLLQMYGLILLWSQWLLWTLGIAEICGLFPYTRPFSNWILGISIRSEPSGLSFVGWPPADWLVSGGRQATLGFPLAALLLVIALALLRSLGNLLVDIVIQRWATQQEDSRQRLRAPTIAMALKGWITALTTVLLLVVLASQLYQFGAFSRSLAIFAGFLSFAISLASQNLLKDLIGGMLILWEDQYAVGDVIIVDDQGGLVEKVGLRVTRLRNLDGELITIPNGLIGMVRNLSSDWSRVNYAIDFGIHVDVDRVLQLMDHVAQGLYQDPLWHDLILDLPEILGVDHIAHTGFTVRMLIKTQPLQQWAVGREYRRRLKNALDEQGIDVGVPRLDLRLPPRTRRDST